MADLRYGGPSLWRAGTGRRAQFASETSSSEEIWLVARIDRCQENYFIEFILISLTIS